MSKYDALWRHVQHTAEPFQTLTFAQVEDILGFPIDHSFLRYKKELQEYGYQVGKISLKEQTVIFTRIE